MLELGVAIIGGLIFAAAMGMMANSAIEILTRKEEEDEEEVIDYSEYFNAWAYANESKDSECK